MEWQLKATPLSFRHTLTVAQLSMHVRSARGAALTVVLLCTGVSTGYGFAIGSSACE